VDRFVQSVKTGVIKVAKGDLARSLQFAVNPKRQREFFEKLISRRKLNRILGQYLTPKVPRRVKREVLRMA